MQPARKAFALMHVLTQKEIDDLPPFVRKRFAAMCRQLADMAESPPNRLPPPGILRDLRMGERAL
jgi:hypothetical protein